MQIRCGFLHCYVTGWVSFTCLLSVPFLTFLGWVYSAICWTEFDLCVFCSYARLDLCDFFIHRLCFVISFSADVVINPGLDLDWFGCVISFTFPSRWYFTDWTWYQQFLHPRISAIWLFTDCAWSLWFLHPRVVLDLCIRGPLFSLRSVSWVVCLCDCLRTHLLSVIYLCNYLQAPNISVVFAYSDLCDIGFTAVSVIWFGWPLRFCYLVIFGGQHDSHRDSSRALLDLCDLYFSWPLSLNLSL